MLQVRSFTFNFFQENTFLLYDNSKTCIIIDPGCYELAEQQQLQDAITNLGLTPVRHLLTHAHLDHVFGSAWVHRTYGLLPECHTGEQILLERAPEIAAGYGVTMEAPPLAEMFLHPGTDIVFGNSRLQVLFVPGHSPASVAFYSAESQITIAGDVLFRDSIGRYDLPGGNFDTLAHSIRSQIYTLPDATIVYCGHGGHTTVGREKRGNPYVKGV